MPSMTPKRHPLALAACLGLLSVLPSLTQAQSALPPGLTPGAAQTQERLQREEQQREQRHLSKLHEIACLKRPAIWI